MAETRLQCGNIICRYYLFASPFLYFITDNCTDVSFKSLLTVCSLSVFKRMCANESTLQNATFIWNAGPEVYFSTLSGKRWLVCGVIFPDDLQCNVLM